MAVQKRKVATDLAPPSPGPFLVATSLDTIKPDAKSRKFIRRYVTKGKKPNRPRPRKRTLGSWFDGKELGSECGSAVLCKGLALALVEPRVLQILHDFVPIMVKVMYPIERGVDLAAENQHWYNDLAYDPPYAQSVSEIGRVHFDVVRSRDQQFQKLVHMSNSLGPLRKQLESRDVVVTDSMIFTVVALALASEAFDELDDALMHLRGLHTMIKLRGGLAALAHKRSLQIKCCRVDLVLAMRTGEKPLLFSADSLMWKPYLADFDRAPTLPWHTLVDTPDIRLVNVWLDLREFTMSINLAHQTNRNISPVLFQEVLISVQYRLHNLTYSSHDRQETLRLAMLALSASLFLGVHCLQSRPLYCRQLVAALGASLRELDQTGGKAYLEVNLWLGYLGRMSVLDLFEDRPWLEKNLLGMTRALGLKTWVEVRSVLKAFLWVDILHDDGGEKIFSSVKSSEVTSPG